MSGGICAVLRGLSRHLCSLVRSDSSILGRGVAGPTLGHGESKGARGWGGSCAISAGICAVLRGLRRHLRGLARSREASAQFCAVSAGICAVSAGICAVLCGLGKHLRGLARSCAVSRGICAVLACVSCRLLRVMMPRAAFVAAPERFGSVACWTFWTRW